MGYVFHRRILGYDFPLQEEHSSVASLSTIGISSNVACTGSTIAIATFRQCYQYKYQHSRSHSLPCVSLSWVYYIVIIMNDEGAAMAVLGNRRVYVDEVVFFRLLQDVGQQMSNKEKDRFVKN